MNAVSFFACVFSAMLNQLQFATAIDYPDSNSNSNTNNNGQSNNRSVSAFNTIHALGGVNYQFVKGVLSDIQNGALDVLLMRVPTRLNQSVLSNRGGALLRYPIPSGRPLTSPFILGPPSRAGGYRGVKTVSSFGGGYRGGPSARPQSSEMSSAYERPIRNVLPQNVFPNDEYPIRGGRHNKGSSGRQDIVVDFSEVIRYDKIPNTAQLDRPAVQAIKLAKPTMEVDTDIRPPTPSKMSRPSIVPVTIAGPPSEDFISKLEVDLVAGLTPQQLEELSFQAIDPREKPAKKKSTNSNVLLKKAS